MPLVAVGGLLNVGDLTFDDIYNVLDVVGLIDVAFRGAPGPIPSLIADVNCDGHVDIVDVVGLVNHVFRGAAQPDCP